jgi:hypothetical protein
MNSDFAARASASASPPNASPLAIARAMINECAAAFHLFSADEPRCLDDQTLHRLLSSESLLMENKGWLLRFLLETGGFSPFLEVLEFEGLTV